MSRMMAAALLCLLLAAPVSAVKPRFEVDPATHLVLLGTSLAVAATLEAVVRTNALEPPAPSTDASALNRLDRDAALDEDPWELADPMSDGVFFAALGFAVTDGILGATLASRESGWAYASIYAETFAFNWALANGVKLAVKRPRPLAYRKVREQGELGTRTDDSLAFYSLHTAFVAGITVNASYLAFVEEGASVRFWLTLAAGTILTATIGALRVASTYHFPTDVIAGAAIGSSIGLVVPFLHDRFPIQLSGAAHEDGGSVGISGRF